MIQFGMLTERFTMIVRLIFSIFLLFLFFAASICIVVVNVVLIICEHLRQQGETM